MVPNYKTLSYVSNATSVTLLCFTLVKQVMYTFMVFFSFWSTAAYFQRGYATKEIFFCVPSSVILTQWQFCCDASVLCGRQDEVPKRRTQKQKVKLKAQLYC